MDTTNPFRSLTLEWATLGRSAQARRALARWSATEPLLTGFDCPAEVVARCQERGDPRAANDLLAAMLRQAHDELATRAVLQAVLPSLAARAWRRRIDGERGGGGGGPWESVEDLDVEVVTFALERIGELAGTSPEWPAQAIVEVSWERLRWSAQVARRRRVDTVPLDAGVDVAAPSERPHAEELAELLVHAVRAGSMRQRDAALIYATRVLGYTPGELAALQRRDVRAVRSQRARAERTLAALAR